MEPQRRAASFLRAFTALAIVLVSAAGCSKTKTTAPKPDTAGSQAKVDSANVALGQILAQLIASNPDRPSDVDFTRPYRLYQEALAADASNRHAHFGVAVVGLLALSADAEVNAAFDEWAAYLRDHVPFSVPVTALRPMGVPLTFTAGRGAFQLPFKLVPLSILATARSWGAATDPQISRVQAILEQRVLIRLDDALAHLDIAAQDPNYTFIVTPQMQGDPGASPAEIDLTDILALRSAASLLDAAVHVAVAYELGFTAYDCASLVEALTPGSGWLALRANGAAHMRSANTQLFAAIDYLDRAITSLLGETDNQDDDVIKLGPSGVARDEAKQLQSYLPQVRDGLTQGLDLTEDWDQNAGTPDVTLTLRPGLLLTDPVSDWKALLPAYTPSTVNRPLTGQYVFDGRPTDLTVDAPSAGNYSASYGFSASAGETREFFYGPTFLTTPMRAAVQVKYDQVRALPNWGGYFDGSMSFNGDLVSGTQQISSFLYAYYFVSTTVVCIPVLTWTATSFPQWAWPDPTLHGLLPGMGSTGELLTTFGFGPESWAQDWVLDWTVLRRRFQEYAPRSQNLPSAAARDRARMR